MKPALLVIDMQKAWFGGNSKPSMESAAEQINAAAGYFSRNGLPVIWIRQESRHEGIVPGSHLFEFIDLLKPEADALCIKKNYSNSFNKTELDAILRKNRTDTVIVSGFCAEWCVLSTYRGAEDLDYRPYLLSGGFAGGDIENLRFVEKISSCISLEEIAAKVGWKIRP